MGKTASEFTEIGLQVARVMSMFPPAPEGKATALSVTNSFLGKASCVFDGVERDDLPKVGDIVLEARFLCSHFVDNPDNPDNPDSPAAQNLRAECGEVPYGFVRSALKNIAALEA